MEAFTLGEVLSSALSFGVLRSSAILLHVLVHVHVDENRQLLEDVEGLEQLQEKSQDEWDLQQTKKMI
jgi:hypothetical protein